MNLLKVLDRKARERFFYRLDAEWGSGMKYRTKSDRSPCVFNVTAPRTDLETYRVMLFTQYGQSEQLWSTEWRELAEANAIAARFDPELKKRFPNGVKTRVVARAMPVLSKNSAAQIALLVAEYRAGCENQTVIKRALEPVKPKVFRSLRLMQVKPEVVIPAAPVRDYGAKEHVAASVAPSNAQLPIAYQLTIFGTWEPVWATNS